MDRITLQKLGLFAGLYVSIGIPHGFFQKVAPYILRDHGMSLEKIGGWTFLFALPWMLKFIWAPLLDRFFSSKIGRRKSWILPLQALSACVFLALAFWDGSDMSYFLRMVVALNLVGATQDAATDGYAVDLLLPSERGWGNGIQIGGYWTGFMLGGGLLLMLQPHVGWSRIYLFLAGAVFLIMIPVWLRAERPVEIQRQHMGIRAFLKRPFIFRVLLIVVLARCGTGLVSALHVPFLHDLGYSLADVGLITGIIGPCVALLGALVGGFLANPIGRRRSLLYFVAANLLTALALTLLAIQSEPTRFWVITVISLEHFISSMAMVALFSFMMDWCRADQSAGEYTLMDSMGICSAMVCAIIAHFMAQALGYGGHYAISLGVLSVVVVVLVLVYTPSFQERNRALRESSP